MREYRYADETDITVNVFVYTDLVACAASFAVLEEGRAAGRDHRLERALADVTLITTSTTCASYNGTNRIPLICRKKKGDYGMENDQFVFH